jgi:hypothetical protein
VIQRSKTGLEKTVRQPERTTRQREIDEDVSISEGAGWNGEIRTRLDGHMTR